MIPLNITYNPDIGTMLTKNLSYVTTENCLNYTESLRQTNIRLTIVLFVFTLMIIFLSFLLQYRSKRKVMYLKGL